MKYLTAEQANEMSVRQINAFFRSIDESNKYPILGKFNATERAIRRVRQRRHDGLCVNDGYEYYLTIESEISTIVNSI